MAASPNDNCASATTVASLPYTDTQSIADNTAEGTDPGNTANPSAGDPAYKGMWYKWTAPSNMSAMADLQGTPNPGIPYLVLGVYTGTCGGSWTQVVASKASNAPYNSFARVKFNAVSGTTYYFHVGALNSTSGVANLKFNLFQTPAAPANDAFANRQVISAGGSAGPIDTRGATKDASDPASSWWGVSYAGVWFQLTPAVTGTVDFNMTGSDFEGQLTVYSGTYPALTELGTNSNFSSGSAVTGINVVAGTPIYIHVEATSSVTVVSGSAPGGGMLTFNVSAITPSGPPPGPPADPVISVGTSPGRITISWNEVTGTPTDYVVEQCEGSGCTTWAQVYSLAAGGASYEVRFTARDNVIYRFRVKAINDANPPGYQDSGWSNIVEAATSGQAPELKWVTGNAGIIGRMAPAWDLALSPPQRLIKVSTALSPTTNPFAYLWARNLISAFDDGILTQSEWEFVGSYLDGFTLLGNTEVDLGEGVSGPDCIGCGGANRPGSPPSFTLRVRWRGSSFDPVTNMWLKDGFIEAQYNGSTIFFAENIDLKIAGNISIAYGVPGRLDDVWLSNSFNYATGPDSPGVIFWESFDEEFTGAGSMSSDLVLFDPTFGGSAAIQWRPGILDTFHDDNINYTYPGIGTYRTLTPTTPTSITNPTGNPESTPPTGTTNCCIEDNGTPGTPNTGNTTPRDPAEIPPPLIWACVGGGLYLSGPDPVPSELWNPYATA